MKFMKRTTAVAGLALAVALTAATAHAQVIAQSGNTIISGANGGPYKISRDGGRTWAPYVVKAQPKPVKLVPVPRAPGQQCDIYSCRGQLVVVPAGTVAPLNGRHLGTGTIDGRRVTAGTNVLR